VSRDFEQILGQIVSIRIKTLGNTNMVASRLIKRGKGSLPVDVRRSKTSLLKLPNVREINCVIHWMDIYPANSVRQRYSLINNWDQKLFLQQIFLKKLLFINV